MPGLDRTARRLAATATVVLAPALLAPLIFAAVILAPVSQSNAQALGSNQPWIMPFNVGQPTPSDPPKNKIASQRDVYDFMWKTFVAVSWPQRIGGNRAQPDTGAGLAPWGAGDQSEGPVVWQSYRRPNEVFVKPRKWPINWNAAPRGIQVTCAPSSGLEPLTISTYSTNYSDNSDGLNQPYIQANYSTGPVTDQNGNYLRYEVGMNQAYFTYVGHYRYYNPKKQENAVARFIKFVEKRNRPPKPSNKRNARPFQPLPNGTEGFLTDLPDYARQGIVEWKAAWKVLDGDDIEERFYRRWAYFLNPDGFCTGPVKVGLVALHIHRVTTHGHFGTTFEQVDNTNLQPAYSASAVSGASPLPAHASLNPGGLDTPAYPNGYEVCNSLGQDCVSGVGGDIPAPLPDGMHLPRVRPITNIVRQVPIPDEVQEVNAEWREKLRGTVWFYYQMIGAQNPNVDTPNPDLGPGVRGAQVSNTTNLINTALESYTQKGWSCALCHQNAFPLGVSQTLPPFGQAWDPLHTISFLLQNARTNKGD